MRVLLNFLHRFQDFLVLVLLEIICGWLLLTYSHRPRADFANYVTTISGELQEEVDGLNNYFFLKEINEQLRAENELLMHRMINVPSDTKDSVSFPFDYKVLEAKVIKNTYRQRNNFIMLAAGSNDGLAIGMGVVSTFGIVGQIKSVTPKYSIAYSILHPNILVSSKIKKTNTICTVQWDRSSYDKANVNFIPRHIQLKVGDTILTSGYNSVFPENILVGTIEKIELAPHMTFYEAKLKLASDFTSLHSVFAIKNSEKILLDSLTTNH